MLFLLLLCSVLILYEDSCISLPAWASHYCQYAMTTYLNIDTNIACAFVHYNQTRGTSTSSTQLVDIWYRCEDIRLHAQRQASPSPQATGFSAAVRMGDHLLGTHRDLSIRKATAGAYEDAARFLRTTRPHAWRDFCELMQMSSVPRADLRPIIRLGFNRDVDESIRFLVWRAVKTEAYKAISRQRPLAHLERVPIHRAGATLSPNEESLQTHLLIYAPKSERMRDALRLRDISRQNSSALLPVHARLPQILEALSTSSVVLIDAVTGSGKTTQVPQMILDDAIMDGRGALCNIICTQPRRIAATSVARTVARERGQDIGQEVGYEIRFEHQPPAANGGITYCTSGILLQLMRSRESDNPEDGLLLPQSISHVILDEIHDQTIDNHLLMMLLRRELHLRSKRARSPLSLILMSATVDVNLIRRYFEDMLGPHHVASVSIPGQLFPVEQRDLQAVCERLGAQYASHKDYSRDYTRMMGDPAVARFIRQEYGLSAEEAMEDRTADRAPDELVVLTLAMAIDDMRTGRSPQGDILIFVAGLGDMLSIRREIHPKSRGGAQQENVILGVALHEHEVFLMHSETPQEQQDEVLSPTHRSSRARIILTTNIAESSVTVPNVTHVIDTGKCKRKEFNHTKRLGSLDTVYTGLDNMRQRRGRAGRQGPGVYSVLVSSKRLEYLPRVSTPEMLRLDLEEVVMKVARLGLGPSSRALLQQCIVSPEDASVDAAVASLTAMGAITNGIHLTWLGQILAELPVDARIGRMCIIAYLIGHPNLGHRIAGVMSSQDPFRATLGEREEADMQRKSFCPEVWQSDTLAVLSAYDHWKELPPRGSQRSDFCKQRHLNARTLESISKIIGQIRNQFRKMNIGQHFHSGPVAGLSESHSVAVALVALVLAPNWGNVDFARWVMRTRLGESTLHPSSAIVRRSEEDMSPVRVYEQYMPVNHANLKVYQLLVYRDAISPGRGDRSSSILREVTCVPPIMAFLFCSLVTRPPTLHQQSGQFLLDSWLEMHVDPTIHVDLETMRHLLTSFSQRAFEEIARSANKSAPAKVGQSALGSSRELDGIQRFFADLERILQAFDA